MLNLKVWTMSLGCWLATTFTLCVLGGVLVPALPIPHQALELLARLRLDLTRRLRARPGREFLLRHLRWSGVCPDSQPVLASMGRSPSGLTTLERGMRLCRYSDL
jgi:hypothetical protein